MFTRIMYGFINEVTRQPAAAGTALWSERRDSKAEAMARARRRIRRVAGVARRDAPLSGTYRVLADSFKRAAGFH